MKNERRDRCSVWWFCLCILWELIMVGLQLREEKNKIKKKSFLEKLDTVQMLILMLLPVGLVALIWVVYLQL